MISSRIFDIADAFDELHGIARSEPGLVEFLIATQTLCGLGDRARRGEPVALEVAHTSPARIPTRALAIRLKEIVDRVPGPSDLDDEATVNTIAVLLANLTRAIVHALFVDYPDLMRG